MTSTENERTEARGRTLPTGGEVCPPAEKSAHRHVPASRLVQSSRRDALRQAQRAGRGRASTKLSERGANALRQSSPAKVTYLLAGVHRHGEGTRCTTDRRKS